MAEHTPKRVSVRCLNRDCGWEGKRKPGSGYRYGCPWCGSRLFSPTPGEQAAEKGDEAK